MSECRLILGDCRDYLPALAEADALVSDPPFGITYAHSGQAGGVYGGKHRASRPAKERQWVEGDAGPFDPAPWLGFPAVLLWGANHFAARLPAGGTWLAWDKHCGQGPDDSFADCEFAWTNRRVKRNIFRHLWKGLACVKAGESNGRRWHPMQKPVGLMRWCLKTLNLPPGSLVCDPYMGSGTTGVAAVQLGLSFVGVECDPRYFAVAERRIAEARGVGTLFAPPTAEPPSLFPEATP